MKRCKIITGIAAFIIGVIVLVPTILSMIRTGNAFSNAGVIISVLFLAAGIVSVLTRDQDSVVGTIILLLIYAANAALSFYKHGNGFSLVPFFFLSILVFSVLLGVFIHECLYENEIINSIVRNKLEAEKLPGASSQNWYYYHEDKWIGPFQKNQAKCLFAKGCITVSTPVSYDGATQAIPAGKSALKEYMPIAALPKPSSPKLTIIPLICSIILFAALTVVACLFFVHFEDVAKSWGLADSSEKTNKKNDKTSKIRSKTDNENEDEEYDEDYDEEGEDDIDDDDDASRDKSSVSGGFSMDDMLGLFSQDTAIEPAVIYNENGVVITANSLTYKRGEANLNVTIENNTNQTLEFAGGVSSGSYNAVNGYMTYGGYLNETLAPGDKVTKDVDYSLEELVLYGITNIAEITTGFTIETADYNEFAQTGPLTIKTSTYETHDGFGSYGDVINNPSMCYAFGYTVPYYDDSGIFNNSGIRVVSAAVMEKGDGSRALSYEIENTRDECVYAIIGDVWFDGLKVSTGTKEFSLINPGCRVVVVVNEAKILRHECLSKLKIQNYGEVSVGITAKSLDGKEICEDIAEFSLFESESYTVKGEEVWGNDDISIYSSGLVQIDDEDHDIHLILVVSNNSSDTYTVDDESELYVNDTVIDSYFIRPYSILRGELAVIDIQMLGESLEENEITEINAIEKIEIGIEVKNMDTRDKEETLLTIEF